MELKTLSQHLRYDPDTGNLYRSDGSLAVGYVKGGYRIVSVKGKQYLAHRLAYFLVTGMWPDVLDHINRDRLDNRWVNLRHTNRLGNAQNAGLRKDSTSGYRGVSFRKSSGKWRAYIQSGGKQHHIGFFNTAEAAYAARQEVIHLHHKSFSNEA